VFGPVALMLAGSGARQIRSALAAYLHRESLAALGMNSASRTVRTGVRSLTLAVRKSPIVCA